MDLPGVLSQNEAEVGVRPENPRLSAACAALVQKQHAAWLQQGIQAVQHSG